MNLLIGGDLVLTSHYTSANIDPKLIKLFHQSDLNLVNLEAPVTDGKSKIVKTGPHLRAHAQSTQDVLKALNIHLVTLANNHILDYCNEGLKETFSFCRENDVDTVGAGMRLEEARKTVFRDTSEGRIAFVNFAENEWTVATGTSAGANPMDIIDNVKQIQSARKQADFVLVIVHGGNEYNPYPSPRVVKQYRFYAECGASAVIGHHTHCVSGYEVHGNVPIVYSVGNFLFPVDKQKPECWYFGVIAGLHIRRGEPVALELTPIKQDRDDFALSIAQGADKRVVFDSIDSVNEALADPSLLEEKWQAFVKTVERSFINAITPIAGFPSRYIRYALRVFGIYKLFLNHRYITQHLNRIRCEAHLDVAQRMFKNMLDK